MTNLTRAFNVLGYKNVDRIPAVHFGYWEALLQEWADQGHISKELAKAWGDGNDADKELDKIIGWDFNWHTNFSPANHLYPAFEYKVLEKLPDNFLRVQNHDGLIERIREGAASIPAEDDYQLKDREAYEKLYKDKIQFSKDRIPYEALKRIDETERDCPLGLHLGSVLGNIRNILSVIGMSYLICDDYDLFKELIDSYADMQLKCAEEVLKTGTKFDFAHYWEDVCFKNGPLISPTMFHELTFEHYKKRNDLCKKYGINVISLDCDGVIDLLLPTWFESGVNTIFPIEIGTWGDQFEPARNKYGKNLLGVGAMDKTALRKDKTAVDAELKRIGKLVAMGGFIPCPDHRIMPGSKFDLVKYYVEKVKEIAPYPGQ
ncbi:MAG: hypothetical protein LBH24_07110 [Clostridiales bacterium]|jgi:uroporphyrinogen decarboxylase|nr:hypothetical protein [Clostridiales bacterium]